eukprot:TRINITY_DN10981_c0_g1_i3.p1 TRINITY_DN10981_c0_g1~~TRINITY_DN10981_c0_g1_i3.p1  ORF type:complete len:197 (+),score=41.20 TRINITY_DN10981_c0_g1_i3:67-657(+)
MCIRDRVSTQSTWGINLKRTSVEMSLGYQPSAGLTGSYSPYAGARAGLQYPSSLGGFAGAGAPYAAAPYTGAGYGSALGGFASPAGGYAGAYGGAPLGTLSPTRLGGFTGGFAGASTGLGYQGAGYTPSLGGYAAPAGYGAGYGASLGGYSAGLAGGYGGALPSGYGASYGAGYGASAGFGAGAGAGYAGGYGRPF